MGRFSVSVPESELKALIALENMQRCLRADVRDGKIPHPSAIHSHLNEIHRFLIEYCCPTHCAEVREALRQSLTVG